MEKEIESKFNELEQRIKTQEELTESTQKIIISLTGNIKAVSMVYDDIQLLKNNMVKNYEKKLANNEIRKLQAEKIRDKQLPESINVVINSICNSNQNVFENLFSEPNEINNQMTRHEINYFLSYFFNPKYESGKFIHETGFRLTSTTVGFVTGRDHASVLHSCKVVKDLRINAKYNTKIEDLLKTCELAIMESLKKEEK